MKFLKFEGKLTIEAIEDAKAMHPDSAEIQEFLKQHEAKVWEECCKGLALPSHLLSGGATSYSNTTASYKKWSAEECVADIFRAQRQWDWRNRVSVELCRLESTDFAGNRRLAELLLILGECQTRSLMAVARHHRMKIRP